jgi:hypothetical protein
MLQRIGESDRSVFGRYVPDKCGGRVAGCNIHGNLKEGAAHWNLTLVTLLVRRLEIQRGRDENRDCEMAKEQ